ncbi:unnamed protein product, partial [Thelazia callipaeda]|uniref:RMI1_C domain-containing protein n=1 Tax=Thelazia callipaeda TaxID=103827 RepID=A0A0N5CVH1_THECL
SCSIFEPHIEPSSSNSKQIQNEQQKKQQEKYSDDFQALKNNTEQGNVSSSQHSSTTSNQKTEDSSKPLLNVKNANKEASLVLPDATLRVIPHVKTMEQCHSLNILSIREAYCQRRFHLIAYRARVQPVMCKLLAGLQFIGQNWTASLRISDESWESLDCLIDNTAIHDLIGFTPQDAQQAMTSNDLVRITYYKRRAQAMIETFNRLDLVLTVEFSSSPNVIPLIVNITNLAAALTLC